MLEEVLIREIRERKIWVNVEPDEDIPSSATLAQMAAENEYYVGMLTEDDIVDVKFSVLL